MPQLGKIGLDVIGVSPDKMKPIDKSAPRSHGLKFPLASDETKTVAEKAIRQTWVEKSMYGRKYMGMERSNVSGRTADGCKVKKVSGARSA